MADVKINMMLNDSGNTIQKRTTETKALNTELTKTQKLAQGVSMSSGGGGGRPPMTSGEVVEYGRSRAVGAGTGASARDFANQAQGLGGLVRLYATVAANIFAVTAAASALSQAMDTSNMVRGLDQLGAASGQNLGTLSKRLVDATDGAVSLREAMEATAKASSAGLSSTQVLQLGDAAKKASLALGVDMGDALSRLSRGISKLEPELLDELGIYVKIDDAVQNYARSVGKTATQLTDFERRQAFAVAALDQAEKKFGSIKLDTNPYTQLLATFRNVMQGILDTANTVLGPVVKLFADSSALIVGAIGLIAFKLLKQAQPAFGEWKAGLRASADAAKTAAANISEALGADFVEKWETKLKLPELRTAAEVAKKELASITTATNAGRLGAVRRALTPDYTPEKKDVEELTKKYQQKQAAIDLLSQKTDAASVKRVQQLQREQLEITKVQTAILGVLNTQNAVNIAQEKVGEESERKPGFFSLEATKTREALRLGAAVKRTDAILEASNIAGQYGFIAGFDTLKKQIDEKGIKGFEKFRTTITGTFSVGISAIGTLISRFGLIGQAIGLAVAGFQLLDSWLSKNTKQLGDATKALEYLDESGENLTRTLDGISKKDPLQRLSVESIQARSTAINDLVSSIQTSFDKIRLAAESANWWDNLIQGIKGIFGQDLISSGARNLTAQIGAVLGGALEGPEKDKFKNSLAELFGTDDIKEWTRAVSKSPEVFLEMMPKALKLMSDFNLATQNNTSRLTEVKNTISEINKKYDEFLISTVPKDAVANLGLEFLKLGDQMAQAFTDTNNVAATLQTIIADPKFLRAFDEQTQAYYLQESDRIKQLMTNVESYRSALAETYKQMQANESLVPDEFGRLNIVVNNQELQKSLIQGAEDLNQALRRVEPQLKIELGSLELLVSETFKKGSDLVSSSLEREFKKAQLSFREVFNITAQGTMSGVAESYAIQRESLEIEKDTIRAQLSLVDGNQRTNSLLEEIALNTGITSSQDPTKIAENKALLAFRKEVEKDGRFTGKNALTNIAEALAKGGIEAQVARTYQASAIQRQASAAQLEGLEAKGAGLDVRERIELSKIRLENENALLDLETKRITVGKEILGLNSANLQYKSKELIALESSLDKEILLNNQTKDLNTINNQIANQQETVNSLKNQTGYLAAYQALEEFKNKKQMLEQNQALEVQLQKKRELEASLNNELKLLEQKNRMLDQAYALEQNAAKVRSARFDLLKTAGGVSQEDAARLDLSYKLQDIDSNRTLELQKQNNTFDTQLSNAKKELEFKLAGNITDQQRTIAQKQYAETVRQVYQNYQSATMLAEDNAKTEAEVARLAGVVAVEKGKQADIQEKLNNQEQIRSVLNSNFTSGLEIQKQELQLMLDKGQISLDNYNEQVYAIDQIARNNEYNNKVLASAVKLQTTLLGIETDRKILSDKGYLTLEEEDRLKTRAQTAQAVFDAEVTGYSRAKEAQDRYAAGTQKLSERTEGYLDAVKKGFDGVGDAIVQWAETGEFSWKKMINSMLADMLRFEMQMQMSSAFKGLRGGILNILGMSAGGVPLDTSWGNFDYSGFSFAKGGAFDSGMEYFAKGGMFTNSIVDNPTIFKFAKGVGMMGEAGPEAIMPLKRDNSGNLGVRAQGGNTEVVVNNYGMEKATAQESVDSRGNRRIEVTIGEMTAGEMSRSGSGTQNALRGTFGLRPQLIRR